MPLSRDANQVLKMLTSVPVRSEVLRELSAAQMLNTTLRSTLWNPEKTLQTDPVLRHVLANELVGAPPLPSCPSSKEINATCGASFHGYNLPPTLLLMHMCAAEPRHLLSPLTGAAGSPVFVRLALDARRPWFDVHTGHARVWALLHVLKYRCLFELLNMRMVVMVQPGELAKCQRICRPPGRGGDAADVTSGAPTPRRFCRCHQAEHHREVQQRNIAEFCQGREHILYAHADVFLSLVQWAQKIRQFGNHTMMPNAGLDGTNYAPTPSACVTATNASLTASNRWWWHLDAKPKCRVAVESLSVSALGGAAGHQRWHAHRECCYGWVDVAYIPMSAQAAFRKATRHSFWDVQCEVALPTMFRAFEVAGIAPRHQVSCMGGCCRKLSWSFGGTTLCAHRGVRPPIPRVPPATVLPCGRGHAGVAMRAWPCGRGDAGVAMRAWRCGRVHVAMRGDAARGRGLPRFASAACLPRPASLIASLVGSTH